jgi:hypothetical protein
MELIEDFSEKYDVKLGNKEASQFESESLDPRIQVNRRLFSPKLKTKEIGL